MLSERILFVLFIVIAPSISISQQALSNYSSFTNTDVTSCSPPCIRVGQPCGYGTNITCDFNLLAASCDSFQECLSFNSNGWLKGCAAPECGASFEVSPNTTLFIKNGGFWPQKPVAAVSDWHYAPSRVDEELIYGTSLPTLLQCGDSWAVLRACNGTSNNISQGFIFSDYILLSSSMVTQTAIVERLFSTWAAISMLSLDGEISRLPRTVGRVFELEKSGAPNYTALVRDQPDYYDAAAALKTDLLGERIIAASYDGEPTFSSASAFLTPQRDYASIGAQTATVKYSVAPDGRIKLASGSIYTPATNGSSEQQPGTLIFDTASIVDFWPAKNWSVIKAGLVGGYLRVVATAGFDVESACGFEQISFAPAADLSGAVLVRLKSTNGTDSNGQDRSLYGYRYFNASREGVSPLIGDAMSFYMLLFKEQRQWAQALNEAAVVNLPGAEGKRQTDSLWGGLNAAISLYVGNASGYGDGSAYWAPNGSLTSEVAPVVEALLSLGLRNIAKGIIAFYFDYFIRDDGSLPECDDCASGGFGDAIADYGEMIEIFCRLARALIDFDGDVPWVSSYLPAFARLSNHTLRLRQNASAIGAPSGEPSHGLVFGSPEHDTCREPDYYYHNNLWLLRGISEAADLLSDVGGDAFAPLAHSLAAEVPLYAADIHSSLSLVTIDLGSGLLWIPPIATTSLPAFETMTESILASYSNFRYYPEIVSSGMLDDATISGLLAFRDARGGVMSGNTRFEGHLDNMPAYGYARAALRLMDVPTSTAASRFWLLVYGHMANYMSRGTFSASEQLPFYSDSLGMWRDYLWEYLEGGIDQCVPSLILSSLMTRWALVFEWRGEKKLWLARGAPRRWYNASEGGFSVKQMPTEFGTVSYNLTTTVAGVLTGSVWFTTPPFGEMSGNTETLILVIRLRALSSDLSLVNASIVNINPPGANVTLINVNATEECVSLAIGNDEKRTVSVVISGVFA
jgi:hypothetical protein